MKIVCTFILFVLIGLGVFAQSFTLDSTFQPYFDIRNSVIGADVEDILELPSSNIIVSGNFRISIGPNQTRDGLLSVRRSGALNTTFTGSANGGGSLFFIKEDVFLVSDGGHLQIDTNCNRFNTTWRQNYIRTVSCRNGIPYFYSDGSSLFSNRKDNSGKPCIIVNAPDTFPGKHIIKVDSLGLYDSTFTHDADSGSPRGFFPYDSNRIFIYGFPDNFSHYDGVNVNGMCRIFLDGTLDTTFTSPFKDTVVRQTGTPDLVEENGSFFLRGRFFIKGSNQLHTLVRFHSDGSLDTNFDYRNQTLDTTSLNFPLVNTVAPTEDKGYLVGGFFNKFQGHVKRSIAKLDSNGRVEPQYFTGIGPDSSAQFGTQLSQVIIIKKSNFGGYYVGGDFLKWDGQPSQPIIRIHGLQGGVGLNENNREKSSILIYPNPSNGILNIKSETEIVFLTVYSVLGQLEIELEPNAKNIQLELPNRKGLFYLQMQDSKGNRISKKVIRE